MLTEKAYYHNAAPKQGAPEQNN